MKYKRNAPNRLYFLDSVQDVEKYRSVTNCVVLIVAYKPINSRKKSCHSKVSLICLVQLIIFIVLITAIKSFFFCFPSFFFKHLRFPFAFRGSYYCEDLRGLRMRVEGIRRCIKGSGSEGAPRDSVN